MKRIAMILSLCVCLILGCVGLFAEGPEVKKSGQFMLSHNLAVEAKYYFQFVKPSTGNEIENSTVSLDGFGEYVRFVGLTLFYNKKITCTVSVSFSDLTMSEDSTTYTMKYHMTIFKGTSSSVHTITEDSENGAGTAVLLQGQDYQNPQGTKSINLAEFSISIRENENENLPPGTYLGTITLTEEIT